MTILPGVYYSEELDHIKILHPSSERNGFIRTHLDWSGRLVVNYVPRETIIEIFKQYNFIYIGKFQ